MDKRDECPQVRKVREGLHVNFLLVYNKVPHTEQLKTMRINYVTVFVGQESGSAEVDPLRKSHQAASKCLAALRFSAAVWGPCLSSLLVVVGRTLLLLAVGMSP